MPTDANVGALRAALIAAWIILIFGAEMALLVVFGLHGPLDLMFDLVFWPMDGAPSAAAPETLLMTGITGAVMAGWGLTMIYVLRHGLGAQESEGWAWRAVLGGAALWFVLDCAASVASGAAANILPNTLFFLAIAVPLWLLRRPAARRASA